VRITTLGEHGAQLVGRDGFELKIGVVPETGKVDPTGSGTVSARGSWPGSRTGCHWSGPGSWVSLVP